MEIFISKLKGMLKKNSSADVNKVLLNFILAMLKIRKHPCYIVKSISAASLVKYQVSKILEDSDDDSRSRFEPEIFKLTQAVAHFGSMSNSEAAAIGRYCQSMLPMIDNESLECFLVMHFDSGSESPKFPIFLHDSQLTFQSAMMEAICGFYKERFVLLPSEIIRDKEIIQAVIGFYVKKGFSVHEELDSAVAMEKDNELINVVFSNYGDAIHFSVENIG